VRIATEGEIAAVIASSSERHGGQLTLGDLKGYAVALREPIAARAGGNEVFLNPPPALGGALVAAMLATLDADAAADPVARARTIDGIDRRWREAPVDPGRLIGQAGPRPAGVATRGTTHVSVIDAAGNAAAVTVSNGEGNGRLVPGCGFMLNNMLGEEDLNAEGFHRWRPGARLGSMMTPGIATRDDGSVIAFGSGGSNRIRTAILQMLVNRCGLKMPLADAIEAPRLHVERGHLDFEDFLSEDARHRLAAALPDHRAWAERNLYFGGVHAAERDPKGGFAAVGDPRRGGASLIV
jgi:gamma-glutamyltranspeptidase/glutathione hydrolase